MANPHGKFGICRLRHRPGNCRPEGGGRVPGPAQGNQCYSLPGNVADLARIAEISPPWSGNCRAWRMRLKSPLSRR